jgi:hypothetical protein
MRALPAALADGCRFAVVEFVAMQARNGENTRLQEEHEKMSRARITLWISCVLAVALSSCAGTPPPLDSAHLDSVVSASWKWANPDVARWASAVELCTECTSEEVTAINRGYLDLDRRTSSRADLVEAKFLFIQWHERCKRRLLEALAGAASRADVAAVASATSRLAQLGVTLRADEMEKVADVVRVASAAAGDAASVLAAFAKLCASQGSSPRNATYWKRLPAEAAARWRDAAFAGPSLVPAITPSRESRWTIQRILSRPELREYARDDQGRVVYRGITFVPGDVLLVNLANPSEGLFTDFSATDNYSYHAAVYVEIENDGARVPCVYESYEHGTRVVPLCTYLSPSHTICAELLHWSQAPSDAAAALSAAVTAELSREHGFNLWLDTAHDAGGRYITCTTAIGNVLQAAGFPLPDVLSQIDSGAGRNLAELGVRAGSFFSPGDFFAMTGLAPSGFVDNGRWQLYAAAAIGNDWVHRMLSGGSIAPKRDGTYRFYLWGATTIVTKSFPYRALLSVFGFTETNFPAGPPEALALVLRLEEELDAGVLKMEQMLTDSPGIFLDQPGFSIHNLVRDPRIGAMAGRQFAAIARWFPGAAGS